MPNAPEKKKKEDAMPMDSEYLLRMSHAETGKDTSVYQLIPVMVFAAVVIMIVRVHNFKRPMSQFDWTSQTDGAWMNDFFSYNKMIVACLCALAALLIIVYRMVTESLAVKRTKVYIPMAVYTFFVLLSFVCSDLKPFAGLGWNDRFEGTLPIIGYMVMLFFTINFVNGERNVKQILWPLAVSSFLLNLLGLGQWLGKDFFMTVFGQKIITANYDLAGGIKLYDAIDKAAAEGGQYFTFEFSNTSYQTVYNPNYVSFYLTLLVPLFTMLLLYTLVNGKKYKWLKSIGLLALIGLQVANVLASRSIGGYFGLGVSVLLAIIVLNKKLLTWWKPVLAFVVVAAAALILTRGSWAPELQGTIRSLKEVRTETEREVTATAEELRATTSAASVRPYFDYFYTTPDAIKASVFGNGFSVNITHDDIGNVQGLYVTDDQGEFVQLLPIGNDDGSFYFSDPRYYEYVVLRLSYDATGNNFITLVYRGHSQGMVFVVRGDGIYYFNDYGNLCQIDTPEAIGFKDNLRFGSGRGYIWSRTIPMLKDTIFIGHGADTFCAYFPQNDYSGKFNAEYTLETVVDKPHNLYMNYAVGTGCISVLALLVLYAMYFVQSLGLYVRGEFGDDYLKFAGSGIFFGITGFLFAGLVNDSSISVMPMFYTLLGTGIAINMMIKKNKIGEK